MHRPSTIQNRLRLPSLLLLSIHNKLHQHHGREVHHHGKQLPVSSLFTSGYIAIKYHIYIYLFLNIYLIIVIFYQNHLGYGKYISNTKYVTTTNILSNGGLTQKPITSPSKAKETASSSNNVKVVHGIADPRPEFKASVTSPLMQQQSRPPPPPIPPHLRPSTINMTTAKAPIARDESMHDLGDSKSPSLAGVNFHDFESPAGNGN